MRNQSSFTVRTAQNLISPCMGHRVLHLYTNSAQGLVFSKKLKILKAALIQKMNLGHVALGAIAK